MTTNDHEAGKVSDDHLSELIDFADKTGAEDIWVPVSIITELRTRRAENQTGAVTDDWREKIATKAVDALFADLRDRRFLKWLFSAHPTLIGALEGEELRSLDEDVQREIRQAWAAIISAALEPTPIKETAEPEHIATDVHSETANAEHVPAVPADVQGVTDGLWVGYVTHETINEVEQRFVGNHIWPSGSLRPENEVPLVRLSDYQRLAAENERLREDLVGAREALRLNKVWDFPADIQALTVKLEAAEGKLAEAVKAMRRIKPYLDFTVGAESVGYHPTMPSAVEQFSAALSSLTTPPTEQGET